MKTTLLNHYLFTVGKGKRTAVLNEGFYDLPV